MENGSIESCKKKHNTYNSLLLADCSIRQCCSSTSAAKNSALEFASLKFACNRSHLSIDSVPNKLDPITI
ncbi:hypothetical protein BLOT_012821 [Blomia tropicalis]|nr:hypothetical protein BLOT_012821 [Blomia tropicalis]